MGLDQAVAEALQPDALGDGATQRTARLTRRQREVTELVAQGLTNRELADRLVIAEGTAQRHVADILGKLGLSSRVHLAAWAIDHGLRPDA
jgi:non-specific serine/threonine protein kinase